MEVTESRVTYQNGGVFSELVPNERSERGRSPDGLLNISHNPNENENIRPDSTVPFADEDDEDHDTGQYDRGTWTGRFDFLLSLLGYSVGLGNVWRFPYLVYSNGGGAFLIPFICMLFLVGFPLMFAELAFGQFASLGPIAIFERFCPLFHGIGYGMVIVSAIVAIYYNILITWSLFYIFASWTSVLPWEHCDPEWSSHECYSYLEADECHSHNGSMYYNQTCFNNSMVQSLDIASLVKNVRKRPPAEDYFENYVLAMSDGVDDLRGLRWPLAFCLLGSWVIVFLCLSKGVQSSGKVVYFTALFPFMVLVLLFFRGVTLDGAYSGIKFYLTPDFSRLGSAKVWTDAAVQIFFALSPAWGGLITLSSYNKFHNNCFKDAVIVSISNVSTSIFAGFVIFSIIGFLAHELGKDVKDVVDQGAGLAFIVYPEVVTRLPISPLWSFLFFFMLLTLGLDSQFALLETVTTAFLDRYPSCREKKTLVVLLFCSVGYVCGLPLCTRGGVYILQLMDAYAASWSVFLLAILECIVIGWIYGAHRFIRDIEVMIGPRSALWHHFFATFWRLLCPATLVFLLVFNWIQYKPLRVGDYVYPAWANGIGWVMALAPIMAVPVLMVYNIAVGAPRDLNLLQRIKHLLRPSAGWGPAHKVSDRDLHSEHPMDQVHNVGAKMKQSSFDNPTFSMNYAYETNM